MTFVSTRGLATEALTETAHIISGTVVDDGGGGGSAVETAGSALACRIDALGGDEDEVADRISDRSTHLVILDAGTDVSSDQDLAIDGRGTFEVTAVREHTGEHARFIEVVGRD